jgi:hypothetical protein
MSCWLRVLKFLVDLLSWISCVRLQHTFFDAFPYMVMAMVMVMVMVVVVVVVVTKGNT